MENKKIIWGGLAGGVTFFLLGWLLYGILMRDYFEGQTTPGVSKEMPDFPYLIIGNLIMGFLYAVVLGSWAKVSSPVDGAKKGFLFALLIGAGYDMIMYSTSNIMSMQGMMVDIVVTLVMGTITGSIVAMVMSPSQKATA